MPEHAQDDVGVVLVGGARIAAGEQRCVATALRTAGGRAMAPADTETPLVAILFG
jgi:hypothetical protein